MKNSLRLIVFSIALLMLEITHGQSGSVDLKTGTGAVISSYSSVTEAYAAIPTVLSTAYIMELKSNYTAANEIFPITFIVKAGASENNRITLRPAAGVGSVSMSASVSTGIISLNDADYIMIDGRPGGVGSTRALTIFNTATAVGANDIQLINGACNNVVRYCTLENGGSANATKSILLSTSATNTTGNSDNLFEFNSWSTSRYGFNSSGTAANPNTRNKIYGCNIGNITLTGIWSQPGTAKLIIDSCFFTCSSASSTTPFGILFDSQTDSAFVTKNTFKDLMVSNTSAVRAIYFRNNIGTSYSLVANNIIALMANNATCTSDIGIEYAGAIGTKAEIYSNTIRIAGTLTGGGNAGSVISTPFLKSNTSNTNDFYIRNNIFINERSGGTAGTQHPAMSLTNSNGSFNMNNNTYNAAGSDLLRYGSTIYESITAWQAVVAPNDANANKQAVTFVSLTNLHLAGASLGDQSLAASASPLVLVDIDNEQRSTTMAYRGADESREVPLPLTFVLFTATKNGNDALLAWQTEHEQNNMGFKIERSFDGLHFNEISFVRGKGNTTGLTSYSFNDVAIFDNVSTKHIFYRLKQLDLDNHFKFSAIVSLHTTAQPVAVQCYPNPTTDIVFANITIDKKSNIALQLLDASGKIVKGINKEVEKGNTVIEMDCLKPLATGMYYLVVKIDDKLYTTTVIKK